MGKDKYSDDHTIEVVGGTNTVNIVGNLNVTSEITGGTLSVEELSGGNVSFNFANADIVCDDVTINSSGNIGVTCDNIDVTNDSLTITSSNLIEISSQDILLDCPDIIMTSTPELDENQTRYKSIGISSFFSTHPDEMVVNLSESHFFWDSTVTTTYLEYSLSSLPDGAIIDSIRLGYEAGHASDQISVRLLNRNVSTGGLSSINNNVTISDLGVYKVAEFTSVNFLIAHILAMPWIRISVEAGSSTGVKIYGVRIGYLTKSVGL